MATALDSTPRPIMKVSHICKSFPGVAALDDVSFDIAPGSVLALLGENGAGKSTLVKILCGVLQQDSGDITFDGKLVRMSHPTDAFSLGIAVIHQELSLAPELNVAENMFLGSKPMRKLGRFLKVVDFPRMYRESEEALKLFHSSVSPRTLVEDLSQMDRQLLEILKAVRRKARFFLMDEPTAGLDEMELKGLFDYIGLLKAQGVAIVYVSHLLEEVFQIADEVLILRDGRQICRSSVKDVTIPQAIKMMTGHDVASYGVGRRAEPVGERVLEVRNLTTADSTVQDVSFDLHRNEIIGVAGLAGSGRSQLLRALYGIGKRIRGEVRLEGRPCDPRNSEQARRRGFGLIPRERKSEGIFGIRSVRENITVSSLRELSGRFGRLRKDAERKAAASMIEKFRIRTPDPSTPIESLSGGNQQKAIFGRWFSVRPKILLCDEPTRGVDIGAKAEVFQAMREFTKQGGAVIVSSSEVHELLGVCGRILVMFAGRVVKELVAEKTTKEELVGYIVRGETDDA